MHNYISPVRIKVVNPRRRRMTALAVVSASLMLAAFTVDARGDAAPDCIPLNAADYRGDLDAWVDIDGRVLVESPTEDSLEWCVAD